jgi:hypothetical protein
LEAGRKKPSSKPRKNCESFFNVSNTSRTRLTTAKTSKRRLSMPKGKHLRGASSREQRQYEHIKKKAQKSGRYGKRAKEVAARTVMKQHKKKKS